MNMIFDKVNSLLHVTLIILVIINLFILRHEKLKISLNECMSFTLVTLTSSF
jgi:hypothetical protein